LLADVSSPKLKDTSAEAPSAPLLEPELLLLDTISPPVLALGNGYRNPHRGDSPMMSTWKLLGLKALLAGALTAAPALAQNSDGTGKAPDLASLATQLEAIKKKVDSIDAQVKPLGTLPTSVTTLKDTLNKLKDSHDVLKKGFDGAVTRIDDALRALQNRATDIELKNSKTQEDLTNLAAQVEKLRKDVDSLSTRIGSTQISAYPPREGALAGTGRVRLVNTYFQPMSIAVNRTLYMVAPGETRFSEPVPAGTFTYEVLGVQPAPQTRQLAANETFTVTVHPQ
jgi:prefoldin subunit 5